MAMKWAGGAECANIPGVHLLASSSFRSPAVQRTTVRRRFIRIIDSLQSAFDADGTEIAAILPDTLPEAV